MLLSPLFAVFIACLVIQLFYYLFFFSKLAFKKASSVHTNETDQGVSVIICAYNEQENLEKLLPLLYKQDFPNFEIIVVDDKSEDGSLKFLLSEKEKIEKLKVISITETPAHINSKKYGLSLGIKLAKNDILLFTDGDCLPAGSGWIKSMAAPFNKAGVKIVLGFSQYVAGPGFLNLFIRFETLYTAIQYMSLALSGIPYMGVGRNLAYSKKLFLETKGFSSHLKVIGGDDDLFVNKNAKKENTRVITGRDSVMYSKAKEKYKEYFNQKKRHLSVDKYYNSKDKLILSLLFISQFLFLVTMVILLLFWEEPYIVIGGFVLRMGIQYLIFYKAGKKLGDGIKLWMLPLLDVLYVIYYIATGISAVFSRDIKWN